ncbi:MAG: hypothetical protein ACRCU3_10355 [Eubacteriaceae bacterium]
MKRKRQWSMDIGKTTTKIAVGRSTGEGGFCVENYWIIKTPWDIFERDVPVPTLDFLIFIKECFKFRKRKEPLTLVIDHPRMIFKSFVFPMMSIEEVEKGVYWKIQTYLSGEAKDWRYDFIAKERAVVFEYLGVEEKELDVLGIAIPKIILKKTINAFNKGKQKINRIIPQGMFLNELFLNKNEDNKLLIDLGGSNGGLFFMSQGFLIQVERLSFKPIKEAETLDEALVEKMATEINLLLNTPLLKAKGFKEIEIICLGGGSLHQKRVEMLQNKLGKNVKSVSIMDVDTEVIELPKKMTEEEFPLLIPCLSGLISSSWESE